MTDPMQGQNAWRAATDVITELRASGHVALLAGGCVRDRLLHAIPKDYDVATDATPQRVCRLFPRARKVGAKFGVILVRRFGCDIEVATFRADGPYSDGRHPDQVTFGTEVQDAHRRDFTINGLFLDPVKDQVIDYVDGRSDLDARLIRTIGDPYGRFAEDHLRMLRAVRFAARLGFQIESQTFSAIQACAAALETISAERIWQELKLILTDPSRALGWSLLGRTGLRQHLTPAWSPDPAADRLTAVRLAALPGVPIHGALALAATLCSLSPANANDVCRSLRLSNRAIKDVVWLVDALPRVADEASLELADLKMLMARPTWPQLMDLLQADQTANAGGLSTYDRVRHRAAAVNSDAVAPPPLLTGDDLVALGVAQGPRFGEILKAVYRAQLNEAIHTHKQAVAMACRHIV